MQQTDEAKELFLRTDRLFDDYIYFDEPGYKTLCITYAVFTHFYDIFYEVPYLQIYGPRGSGKSRLGEILAGLCFNPVNVDQITPAALYRTIDAARSGLTLIVDESDDLSTKNGHSPLLRILRGGYRRNRKVVICGPKREVLKLCTFCPKVIISLEGIRDQALDNRTIPILMTKSRTDLEKYRSERAEGEYKEIRSLLRPFLESYRDPITSAYMNFESVEGISGRDEEIWTPIFLVADCFGKRHEMEALAKRITLQRKEVQLIEDRDTQILAAIQTFINKKDPVDVEGFYSGDQLFEFIKGRYHIPKLRLESISRVLRHHKIIKQRKRPRFSGDQQTCYLFDKERLAELTKEYFQGGEL